MAGNTTGEDHYSGVDIRSRESSAFEPPSYEISYASDHTLKWDPPQGSMELAIALSYHFPIERDLECKMRAATKKFLKAEARKNPLNWNSVLQRTKAAIVRAGQGPRSPKEMASTYPPSPNLRQQVVTFERELGQNARNESSRETPPEPQSLHSNANPVENTSGPGRPKSSTHPSDVNLDPPSSESLLKIVPWDSGLNGFLKRKKRRYGMEERTKVAGNRGNACADHQRKKMKCDPKTCPQNKQNMNKDILSRSEDKGYQERKMESGWAPSTTMLGSIDVTESNEKNELFTGISSTFERDFNDSVDCPPPKSVDAISSSENKTHTGHSFPRAAEPSPQLRKSTPHSSLSGIRSKNDSCDDSSFANINFQHSAPLSQPETAFNASTFMTAHPYNLEEWDAESDFPSWLSLPSLDGDQIIDHEVFNLNDGFEQEGPLARTTTGAAVMAGNKDLFSHEFEFSIPDFTESQTGESTTEFLDMWVLPRISTLGGRYHACRGVSPPLSNKLPTPLSIPPPIPPRSLACRSTWPERIFTVDGDVPSQPSKVLDVVSASNPHKETSHKPASLEEHRESLPSPSRRPFHISIPRGLFPVGFGFPSKRSDRSLEEASTNAIGSPTTGYCCESDEYAFDLKEAFGHMAINKK